MGIFSGVSKISNILLVFLIFQIIFFRGGDGGGGGGVLNSRVSAYMSTITTNESTIFCVDEKKTVPELYKRYIWFS